MTDREFLGKIYFLLQHESRATVICDQLEDMLAERLKQPEQWEQLYSGMGNPFKRPATRDEKIVRPGVYEIDDDTQVYRSELEAAVRAEREACAKVADAEAEESVDCCYSLAVRVSSAIRARGDNNAS